MSKKKRSLLSTVAAQMTAMISVSLVLIVIGLLAIGGVAARSFTSDLQSRMGFSVVMADNVSADTVKTVLRKWKTEPYVASYKYISPTNALERWQKATGDDNDIVSLLGVNPFNHEMEVSVKPQYSDVDSLRHIIKAVSTWPGVKEVRMQAGMIHSVNKAIYHTGWVLGAIAAALLVISVILINNMVRLTIYARRFVINTMKFVGATAGFIRRPFVWASIVNGMIAGVIAVAVLFGVMAYAYSTQPMVEALVPGDQLAIVLGGVFLLGVIICATSSWIATTRYLRLDIDALYQ